MNQRQFLFGLAAVALLTVVMVEPSFATGAAGAAGATAKSTLENAITGNLGLILGLGITIAGLWTWIIGQKTAAGLTMVLGGVLLTLAPGLFNGARKMVGGVVTQFSGGNVEQVEATYNQ